MSAVAEHLRATCARRRHARAIVPLAALSDQEVWTFDGLLARYESTRAALASIGADRGSVLVSTVGNRPIFFALLVACLDAGVSLVPLGDSTEAEALAIVERCGAALVVTARDLPVTARRILDLDREVRVIRLKTAREDAAHAQPYVMKLTSGSTDLPKAALSTEANLLSDTRNITEAMSIGGDDVNLSALPLSHAYAISNVVMPLIQFGTSVALRPSFSPSHFLRDVEAVGATVFPGVPFMFEHLRNVLPSAPLPKSLRLLASAGAPLEPATVQWFHRHVGRKIHSFYGSSEAGGIAFDDADDIRDPVDVGHPLPRVAVEIRSGGSGRDGRVFVKSDAVSAGYSNSEGDDDVSAFRDGGFLSGDLGHFNGAGRLVLTGRVSPLINVAGRKVDPSEVERALRACAHVAEARVLGAGHETRGEELVAFVVRTSDGITPLTLRQHCARTLSPYKIPRRFVFLERLPLTPRGKVDRKALEALL